MAASYSRPDGLEEGSRGVSLAEACGVTGIYAPGRNIPQNIFHALYALQHRGQESAGIATADGEMVCVQKGMGLLAEVFAVNKSLAGLGGVMGIGHVRYSTTGASRPENAQPIVVSYRHGRLAIAHNGNLVNAAAARQHLEEQGSIFQTTTDSELIAHLIARSRYRDLESAVKDAVSRVRGSYVFLLMVHDRLIGVMDPYGIRPASIGCLDGEHYMVVSETCALDTMGAEFVRDMEPGEMVVLDKHGISSDIAVEPQGSALCIFEFIYFARPDSNLRGRNVHLARRELGRYLARECPAEADVVIGVPDSSIAAASGYAEEIGLPYELALVKNRYIGRTFIQPTAEMRSQGVHLKLNPITKIIEGRRVVIVDDSIVRGTTSSRLVEMLWKSGAKEIHLRISSPPVISPCYYGINTSSYKDELIASHSNVSDIEKTLGVTSLGFLSIPGMLESIDFPESSVCKACFDERYPVPIEGREADARRV